MKSHEDGVVILLARYTDRNALRHRAPDIFHTFRTPVASKNPDHALLAVPFSEELAIALRRSGRKNRFVIPRILDHPTAPGRQQPDIQSVAIRFVDDVVDMVPVIIFGGFRWIRP